MTLQADMAMHLIFNIFFIIKCNLCFSQIFLLGKFEKLVRKMFTKPFNIDFQINDNECEVPTSLLISLDQIMLPNVIYSKETGRGWKEKGVED